MVRTAIAGGRGNLGAALVEVLSADPRHEVFVFARGEPKQANEIQVDYTDVGSIQAVLEKHQIEVVISTIRIVDHEQADAEKALIRAAAASSSAKRFVPSVWGINYPSEFKDLVPFAKYKDQAVEELRKTDLEWTRFCNGYFLDYYAMPHLKSHLTTFPANLAIDVANKVAGIPGTGDDPVTFTYTYDVGRFVAEALTLPKWEEDTYIIGEEATLNQLLAYAEEARGTKFDVTYDDIDKLRTFQITELPIHQTVYQGVPKEHLQAFFAIIGQLVIGGHMALPRDKSLNLKFPHVKPVTVKEAVDHWKGK